MSTGMSGRRLRRRIDRRHAAATATPTVRRELRLPQKADRVWQALTEADQLARWLLPVSGNISPTVGHRFAFTAPGGEPIHCTVIHAEPGRQLSYTWQTAPDQPATTVTWTLEPDANSGGTRLYLEHDPGTSPALLLTGLTNGWSARLRAELNDNQGRHPQRRYKQINRQGVLQCL